jgi:hypothetical protein
MYTATILETLIASPGDVIQERQLIRDAINEWNIVNSKSRNIVLRALGWENGVYSSFTHGSPQEAINKQILENADILVGVFWTKVGTPTGNYVSGSVEEITKHIESGKPALLFFSNSPVRPDSVNQDQYSKLLAFKEWAKTKGVYFFYDSIDEFPSLFSRQIGLLINNHPIFTRLSKSEKEVPRAGTSDPVIKLSEDAKQLLGEIAQDQSGQLVLLATLGGYIVQTNGKNFGSDRYDARRQAQLNSIIEELENKDLIRAANSKREIFRITAKGYEVADSK